MGATGRTDLPTGNPEALYDSLFNRLLQLDPALIVHPAHEYKGRDHSTIGQEIANNPRLQVHDRAAFVEMMNSLNLSMPPHLTEALRTNMSGGKTVAQMLAEAAATVPFMSLAELKARTEGGGDELIILDVRERDAYEAGHIPGAKLLPRGQLELRRICRTRCAGSWRVVSLAGYRHPQRQPCGKWVTCARSRSMGE
jgi:hypothetical protein